MAVKKSIQATGTHKYWQTPDIMQLLIYGKKIPENVKNIPSSRFKTKLKHFLLLNQH